MNYREGRNVGQYHTRCCKQLDREGRERVKKKTGF